MNRLTSFVEFSKALLAGQEGAFFTDGTLVEFQTGKPIWCDFDAIKFPFFVVTDFLGKQNKNVFFDPSSEVDFCSNEDMMGLFEACRGKDFQDIFRGLTETEDAFIQKGEAIQAAQRRGEMWVMNLTHRVEGEIKDKISFLAAYYRFLQENPSHVGGVFWTRELCFVSFSPELFLRQKENILETCPIKGTGKEKELLESTKEQAELFMVTDLLRNDLGQISTRVWVESERSLVFHNDFSHTHARIKAEMSDENLSWKRYQKLLPAGSISGCPKKRVLQYIHDLEGYDRNFYTGTFGVRLSPQHSVFNLLIRTFFLQEDTWTYPVGAGITHKSDLSEEYKETLQKASYLKRYFC